MKEGKSGTSMIERVFMKSVRIYFLPYVLFNHHISSTSLILYDICIENLFFSSKKLDIAK